MTRLALFVGCISQRPHQSEPSEAFKYGPALVSSEYLTTDRSLPYHQPEQQSRIPPGIYGKLSSISEDSAMARFHPHALPVLLPCGCR
jgi:hypothetical protein